MNMGRKPSDGDGDSIMSVAPTTTDAGIERESILGEVIGEHEKSLLRSLGHRFADKDSLSLFPNDPQFEEAFKHEFDDIEDMDAEGTNEGQHLLSVLYVELGPFADTVCNRIRDSTVARQVEAFSRLVVGWKAHIQQARKR